MNNDNEGKKFDHDKLPYHLLPPELLGATTNVLKFGAEKYGEDRDSETGMSHLWHASCCIAFLIAYEERRVGQDDRFSSKPLK